MGSCVPMGVRRVSGKGNGMAGPVKIYQNLPPEVLLEHAISRNEGTLSSNGALTVQTGARTGRSPKDRFIVKSLLTEDKVDWGTINQPLSQKCFGQLWQRVDAYLHQRPYLFTKRLCVGANPDYQVPFSLVCELAWHALFADHLFMKEPKTSLQQDWTVLFAPNFETNPVRDGVHSDATIALDFDQRRLLICGTHYAGELKKGMFTVLNFILPTQDVLPMHCSANQGPQGDVALFFGLSGTGKTTLSADPDRFLIGDDEHGWGPQGVFNFEGGCYAKCIHLSPKNEPIIWQAIRQGAVMENVVLDSRTKDPLYADESLTQNTRVAYPLDYVEKHIPSGQGGHPENIIFLSCDLYGVLPPLARLTKEQAAYYFLSGYTALIGSTEVGSETGIQPTFSACFGAPFFPRSPQVYAHLLMDYIQSTQATVYLVNTGWGGGAYENGGTRFSIPTTRAVIRAILTGEMRSADYIILPGFNFEIPKVISGVEATLLDPRTAWKKSEDYRVYADRLIQAFQKNFEKFGDNSLRQAGPLSTSLGNI